MRQTIESAPRDQEDIILEDDASGAFDVAHWSPEAGKWISENGEPSKITPTHWHPLPQDQSLQQPSTSSHTGRARLRFAALSIAAAVILAGLYFRAEAPIWVTRDAAQQDTVGARRDRHAGGSAEDSGGQAGRKAPAPETGQSSRKEPRPEIVAKQAAAARDADDQSKPQLRSPAANATQSHEQDRENAAALALEATAARQEQAASTEQQRHLLQEERARAAALASELATTRHEIEANTAQLAKARDDAAQFKQTAERATAEQLKERESAEALARELAMARREIEANTAQLTRARDDATQLKQSAEGTTAAQQKARESAETSVPYPNGAPRDRGQDSTTDQGARGCGAVQADCGKGNGGPAERARECRGSVP